MEILDHTNFVWLHCLTHYYLMPSEKKHVSSGLFYFLPMAGIVPGPAAQCAFNYSIASRLLS